MQIKTTMRYHFTLVKIAIINKSTNNKCQQGCGERRCLLHCWWECQLGQPLWKTVWNFLKELQVELPFDPGMCSRNVSWVGYVSLSVVTGSWLLLDYLHMGLTLSLADCEHQSTPECTDCWPHEMKFASTRSGAWWDLPLDMLFVKLILSCLDTAWISPLGVFCSLLGLSLVQNSVRHFLWLALGNLFGATKSSAICGCLCWALVCVGRIILNANVSFHQYWVLGASQQKDQNTLRYGSVCLHLLDAC